VKISFEGKTISEVLDQMQDMLKIISPKMSEKEKATAIPKRLDELLAEGPSPEPAPKVNVPKASVPVDKPVESPADKMAKVRAARGKKPKAAPASEPVEEKPAPEPDMFASKAPDPADMVKIRQSTIEALQTAYANGHQKEVFELLSRFGNGAKSFRELPPDAFVPISEAIANGALT